MKQNHKIVLLTVLLAACLAVAASAQNVELLAAGPRDLAAADLVAAPGWKALELPREPVAVSWALPSDKALEAPAPFVARSKEYRIEISAAELERGVAVLTGAPGALVRLNPVPGQAFQPLDPHALVLTDPTGKAFAAGTGMELTATAEELKAAGAPFVEGTAAFRIRAELGAGTFRLQGDGLAGRYVLHVLDAGSDVALALRTLAGDYLHGQQLVVETDLGDAALKMAVDGFVTSPAGRAWPVTFSAVGKGVYRARLELDALEAPAPGLWQVHVRGQAADRPILRSARVAFNVAVPSARLTDAALKPGDALAVRLGVETAAAGRYEVRGVLYGTAPGGALQPIAVGHSAAYLAAGQGALDLAFDRDLVTASGLKAPFEVRDLRLVDQGTMGLLHRQARGLSISE